MWTTVHTREDRSCLGSESLYIHEDVTEPIVVAEDNFGFQVSKMFGDELGELLGEDNGLVAKVWKYKKYGFFGHR